MHKMGTASGAPGSDHVKGPTFCKKKWPVSEKNHSCQWCLHRGRQLCACDSMLRTEVKLWCNSTHKPRNCPCARWSLQCGSTGSTRTACIVVAPPMRRTGSTRTRRRSTRDQHQHPNHDAEASNSEARNPHLQSLVVDPRVISITISTMIAVFPEVQSKRQVVEPIHTGVLGETSSDSLHRTRKRIGQGPVDSQCYSEISHGTDTSR